MPCLSAAGLVVKPFRCGLRRRLQCPGFIAGTLQLSNIRDLLVVTLWNWRAIAVSPDVGSVVSFPKASATLSTSTPDAEEKRATLWLMDANVDLTAYPP